MTTIFQSISAWDLACVTHTPGYVQAVRDLLRLLAADPTSTEQPEGLYRRRRYRLDLPAALG